MPFFSSLRGSNDNFRDGMFEMEIGNDIDELRNDDRVKFILQLSDSDDNSSESGFSEVSYGHVIGHSDKNFFSSFSSFSLFGVGASGLFFMLSVLRYCVSYPGTSCSFICFRITSLHFSCGLPICRCTRIPSSIFSLLRLHLYVSPNMLPISALLL